MICLIVAFGPRLLAAADPVPPPLAVVYFVPSDREPIPHYVERLDRVMTEVQRFYRRGMVEAGYGPLTFALPRDEQGRLQVYVVRGQHPIESYGRNDAAKVRREVIAALGRQGVCIEGRVMVIFQVLLRWDGNRATEIGPYCGGGNHLSGTAWVYDDALLDAAKLASKAPGGYYVRPCSIGEFNSHYIGGVAHELGHAFGLPHDKEKESDRHRGHSLMGSGNHTYGFNLRGEGPGTFLTEASAMPLASVRAFVGPRPRASDPPSCRLTRLDAWWQNGKIVLSGQLDASPPAYGIVGYNDPEKPPGNYDAVGWTCKVDPQGCFQLEVGQLKPGKYQLRLRICHANGAKTVFPFDYQVDSQGKPQIDEFRYFVPLREATDAFARGDRKRVAELAGWLRQEFRHVDAVRTKAECLLAWLDPPAPVDAARLSPNVRTVAVSELQFQSATVGWGRPLRNRVRSQPRGGCFLEVGGRVYPKGLYAHAPSRYVFQLNGRWKQLSGACGLQDGHNGSVVFVIRGDGKELFRSPLVRDHSVRRFRVDVSGIDRLELLVDDGGDGRNNDWAVWLVPELER